MLARIIIIYLFLLVGIGGFALPVSAQSQDDFFKVCWTRDQCLSDGADKDSSKNSEKGSKYEFVPGANLPSGDVCRVQGQENEIGRCYYKPSLIDLNVKIPLIGNVKEVLSNKYFSNSKVRQDKKSGEVKAVAGFPVYIALLYAYFTSIAGIVAVTVMAYGGYQWMVAGGNADKISQAKSTIQGAFVGLVLVLGSYVILDQINSKLVIMKDLRVERIKPLLLAQTCNELNSFGVNDLVTADNKYGNGISPDEAECGVKYFSKSNPSQQCIGISCDGQGKRSYCAPYDKGEGWKCGSEDDLLYLCSGRINPESDDCLYVNQLYSKIGFNYVCALQVWEVVNSKTNACETFNKFICNKSKPKCEGDPPKYKIDCEYKEVDKTTSEYCTKQCAPDEKCWEFSKK